MKCYIKIVSVMFFAILSINGYAQSSVQYKGVFIPIVKSAAYLDASPTCSDLSNTKKNVIYFDDLGPYPNRDTANGGDDPNGFQDMVIVLALANYHSSVINLLGVGTTNQGSEDYDLLRKVVTKSGLTIPAWSEDQIYARIDFYARCPQITSSKRLAVAMGGEWNKLGRVLGENTLAIADKIEAAGLPSYNIRDCGDPGVQPCPYYDGNPRLGYYDTYGHLNPTGHLHVFTDPLFREPYNLVGINITAANMDDLYDDFIRKGLVGIRDSMGGGNLIASSSANTAPSSQTGYEKHIRQQHPNGSRLKIADYLTVAKFIWPNDIDKIHTKSFIHPRIKAAITQTYIARIPACTPSTCFYPTD